MKEPGRNKNRNALKRLKVPAATANAPQNSVVDADVIDVVLNTLYRNADKDILNLENDIYKPANIQLPHKEAERLWEVMISTGWITPTIGFGNSGKVGLSRAGYQLLAQFGSYKAYLASLQQNNQPQTIIMPFQLDNDEEVIPPDGENKKKSNETKK